MEQVSRVDGDPIRTKWEVIDGRRVRLWCVFPAGGNWRDARAHPPILLLHGLGCSVEVWGPAMREWVRAGLDRPVFAADMPGYGKSQAPADGKVLGVAQLADWHARLLDVLGIPRAHLGGNSMGCQVALALARHHPERAGGLVLVGPTEGGDLVPFWRTTLGLLADVLVETMLYNGTIVRMYLQMGVPRYLATVKKMWRDDPVDKAGKVASPTLIIRGSRDMIVPEQAARRFALDLPRGSFMTVDGSVHAVQFNKPEAFARIARAFWERAEIEMAAD